MQVRGLLVAVVVLGLLAGAVYWSDRQKTADEAKEAIGGASKLVQNVSNEDVRKLEIQRRDAPPVVLERDASNTWQMRAPEQWRVDQSVATEVAGSYVGLAYDRVVEEKPGDLSAYGLVAPAVSLNVVPKDGKVRRLLIGDESPTGTGVYLKLDGDPRVFLVSTSVKTTIDKGPAELRDKRLLVFDAGKLSRIEMTSKTGPIEFGRNAQKEWQIVKPKPQRADNGKVEELVQKLSEARMDASAASEDAGKAASNFAGGGRIATITIADAAGPQVLEVRKRGEEYFAKSSAVAGVFKIANDVGESLNKSLDEFRNRKLFDFAFNEPSSVSVRDDAKTYSFRKSGEKWTNAAGKQMDPTSVQSLIDKLRDLAATRFVDKGFGIPVVEAGLTWNDGKRSEKVLVSKVGEVYLAQRENEPATTYEVDAKAIQAIQQAAAEVKEPPPPPPPAPPANK